MAMSTRFKKHPSKKVSFVLDTNPNYTNICNVGCSFCAFHKHKNEKGAYHKTPQEVLKDIQVAYDQGLTTILLQGGVHAEVTVNYLVELVRLTKKLFPQIDAHFFSAPEIFFASKNSNTSIENTLKLLFDAGQKTIPGGGAEVLSERIQKRISPKKLSPTQWLHVHEMAHLVGFKTTATMMYGHVEKSEDLIQHLSVLRDLQDKTAGFSAFIPWSYKRAHNPLGKIVSSHAHPQTYLRLLAVSRLFLDNFEHITASWFGEGKSVGVVGLLFGANDFGGTICQEEVHKAAGHINKASHEEMKWLIRQAGFEAVQRNAQYRYVHDILSPV
jgi:CofH subfamily radical SAM domain protein